MPRRPTVHASVVGTVAAGRNDAYIFECVETLLATTRGAPFDLTVTAVDNSPGRQLAARLRRRFPEITVIENTVPRGFAANHNAALRGSAADYFLVLNDDLRFLPGAVERAVRYMDDPAHARVAVVAFQLRNPDGSVQPSTYSFPTIPSVLLDYVGLRRWIPFGPIPAALARWAGRGAGRSRFWAHDRTLEVQTFRGAAMLVRATVASGVGEMDECTMLGGEDTEWHKRFWDAGWRIVFLHDAEVVHYGSQTIATNPTLRAEAAGGVLNYFWKHRSKPAFVTVAFALSVLLALRALGYAIAGRREMAGAMVRAARTALRWVRSGPPAPWRQPG